MLTGLYEVDTDPQSEPGTYKGTTDNALVDGKAYYYRTGTGEAASPYVYTYCVFLPLQVKDMYELDKEAAKVETTEAPVDGQTYFDKYNYNDAERYAKVIKVQ